MLKNRLYVYILVLFMAIIVIGLVRCEDYDYPLPDGPLCAEDFNDWVNTYKDQILGRYNINPNSYIGVNTNIVIAQNKNWNGIVFSPLSVIKADFNLTLSTLKENSIIDEYEYEKSTLNYGEGDSIFFDKEHMYQYNKMLFLETSIENENKIKYTAKLSNDHIGTNPITIEKEEDIKNCTINNVEIILNPSRKNLIDISMTDITHKSSYSKFKFKFENLEYRLIHGNINELDSRLNLIILADAYMPNDKELFFEDAQDVWDHSFLKSPPFSKLPSGDNSPYSDMINIIAVFSESYGRMDDHPDTHILGSFSLNEDGEIFSGTMGQAYAKKVSKRRNWYNVERILKNNYINGEKMSNIVHQVMIVTNIEPMNSLPKEFKKEGGFCIDGFGYKFEINGHKIPTIPTFHNGRGWMATYSSKTAGGTPLHEFGHAMGFPHQHPEDDCNHSYDNPKISASDNPMYQPSVDNLPVIWKWIIEYSDINGNCYECEPNENYTLGAIYSAVDQDCVVSFFKGANEAKNWYRPSLKDIMGYSNHKVAGETYHFRHYCFAPVESANVAYDLWKIKMGYVQKIFGPFDYSWVDTVEDDYAEFFAEGYFMNEYRLDQVEEWHKHSVKGGLRCSSLEGMEFNKDTGNIEHYYCKIKWGEYGGCNEEYETE